MKVKTSELTGHALDWMVAKAEGRRGHMYGSVLWLEEKYPYSPSAVWSQGGPIIEREGIELGPCHTEESTRTSRKWHLWVASISQNDFGMESHATHGFTPLIAAMRCYVASKFGDEVDVPDEVVG